MKTVVFFTLRFPGVHHWPECDIPEVAYLRDKHRHVFHVRGEVEVSHSDRDVEFIRLKRLVTEHIHSKFPGGDMGATSCEMLAESLVKAFNLSKCEVSEDGENGAVAYGTKDTSEN